MNGQETRAGRSPAIRALNLRRSFGEVEVLRGVDFTVAPGEIFALLGTNGAGKTTVIRILSTLLRSDSGSAEVLGRDTRTQPSLVREAISLTGQFAAVDDALSAHENIVLVAKLRHIAHPHDVAQGLLQQFSLEEAAHRRVATFSGGMRRRLDIAMGLVGDPAVIFLDEPTTGLDPESRRAVWRMITELAAAARQCCSPPSNSRKPNSSPTASRSCTAAGSLPPAPCPS